MIYYLIVLAVFIILGVWGFKQFNFNRKYEIGQTIDSFNGVSVYYNGGVNHVEGRNLSADGYNIGLKYQCVEFVKRYYYEQLNHKMPDSYGHAKDFFDKSLPDGALNSKRNLKQYKNPSSQRPEVNDLIVFKSTLFNRFGHVAIISKVEQGYIEIIQQNPGPYRKSREKIPLKKATSKWEVFNERVIGWLRKND